MDPKITDLLLQAVETELGGVALYTAAIECAVNAELKEEWQEYLEQTFEHVERIKEVCRTCGIDPEDSSPGRKVVKHLGEGLLAAIQMARRGGDREQAQLVAAECLVLAETKDHMNWELIGQVAKHLRGDQKAAVTEAFEATEEEEDKHYYHGKGWLRELWLEAMGMPAVLPPPEEQKDVTTAIGAARAEQARNKML